MGKQKELRVLLEGYEAELECLLESSESFREIFDDYSKLLGELSALTTRAKQADPVVVHDIGAALSELADEAMEALNTFRTHGQYPYPT